MPAVFKLELNPGQHIALDTTCFSDDLDMARIDDGTVVDGAFWGCLKIHHADDDHHMEFSGTRITSAGPDDEPLPPNFWFDSRTLNKLVVAAKPTTAKCNITILSPEQQYCDVFVNFGPMWRLGATWPPAESMTDSKVKFFLRAHPGGALEHFESEAVVTSLYYEAM